MLCPSARLAWCWRSILVMVSMPCACSRTQLPAIDPCDEEDAIRQCANHCGSDGTQVCKDGAWQACVVPPRKIRCSNACGEGLAECVNGAEGECVIAESPVESCETDCGPGTRICEAGSWGQCVYAGGPRACSNECGSGTQACINGKWATCTVERKEEACSSACGSGKRVCEGGTWTSCDAPQPLPPKLHATIRDFTPKTNSDFQREDLPMGSISDRGAVLPELGDEDLPVLASSTGTRTIHGPETFNQWFRDVPEVNITFEEKLQLAASPNEPGMFVYEDSTFFPIDGRGFGNYSSPTGTSYGHNYHFTLMVKTEFRYVGGETFSFSGDDDMWVFINRRLAIDLGGVHEIQTASVKLDEQAGELGISPGNTYSLHFFFAERRTVASNFMIRTTIADVGSCP